VEQDLLTLPEHLSLPPVFSGVRFTPSLGLCVCLIDVVFSNVSQTETRITIGGHDFARSRLTE